jgi:hypothetical protein
MKFTGAPASACVVDPCRAEHNMPANGCNGHGAPRPTREIVRTYLPRAEQHRFSRKDGMN